MESAEFISELRRLRASVLAFNMYGGNFILVCQLIELVAVALDDDTFNNMKRSEAINKIAAEIAALLAPMAERIDRVHLTRFKQLYIEN